MYLTEINCVLGMKVSRGQGIKMSLANGLGITLTSRSQCGYRDFIDVYEYP